MALFCVIIYHFWKNVLSGCNKISAAHKNEHWKRVMSRDYISVLKDKTMELISPLHLFVQAIDAKLQVFFKL